nr:response regulator [Eubacterium sp.]
YEDGKWLRKNDRIYTIEKTKLISSGAECGVMYAVRDITEMVTNLQDIEEQKEIAEKASRAKSEFLARMSHEIRTPINAVMGMNEMILRETKEREIREHVIDIRNSAGSLLSIINEILDSAKIESGGMTIECVDYRLGSVLLEAIQMTRVKAEDKGLHIVTELQPSLPDQLYGDDVHLRQILVNLLNNAVKYTEKGRVTLAINGRMEGDQVVLSFQVRDTGIGIRKEDIPRLFSNFGRLQSDKTHYVEGTGLGLGIAANLLKLMGSELHVESSYGRGSVFYFDLRQKVVGEEKLDSLEKTTEIEAENFAYQESFVRPDVKILLVDDNAINRKVFVGLLKKTQVQIVDVESGQRCLEEVQKQHFDLIFLDHMMPEMDGIETLERLNCLPGHPIKDTVVIALTANAIAGARETYLSLGFKDYLAKPVDPPKLEKMIREYIPEEGR